MIWLLFAGMMWSRAIMSIGVVLFPILILAFYKKEVFRVFWQDVYAKAGLLMFALASLTLLWSPDFLLGLERLKSKAMLFLIPLLMIGLPLSSRAWRIRTLWGIVILHLIPISMTAVEFFANKEHWINVYNQMGTLPVGKYNDHIRFTLSLILLNVILGVEYIDKGKFKRSIDTYLYFVFFLLSVIFIHLLASKSGLILLYLAIAASVLIGLKKWWMKLAAILMAVLFVWSMVQWSPTFRKKIDMVKYEWDSYQESGILNYNNSDQGRIISYDVALNSIKENPILGVGLGGVDLKIKEMYEQLYPEVPVENHLIPHNQFLFSVLNMGIVLGLIYVLLFFVPEFFTKVWTNKLRLLVLFVIFASFLPESTIEVQFGLFICLFYIYWTKYRKTIAY